MALIGKEGGRSLPFHRNRVFLLFSLHLHVDGGVSVYIFCNMYYRFMIASTALSNSPAQQTKERGVRHAQEQQQPVAAHTIKGIKQYGLGYF